MPRRVFLKVFGLVMLVLGLLLLSVSSYAGNGVGIERAKEVQQRNTERLMAIQGVVGTAVAETDTGGAAVAVFLERPGVGPIPRTLEGVPVRPVVTGKFYALAKPAAKPEKPGKPPKDTTPPGAPSGLTATTLGSTQITLDWDDNSDPDLSYYNVYRSTVEGAAYSIVASRVGPSDYLDSGLASSTTYYYVVSAVDTSGNESSLSDKASATTYAGVPRVPVAIGTSTGHPNITAGTIGCRVKDTSGNLYALSNNHVYADENRASIGDIVLAPGPYDGGQSPEDRIGTLAAFEPIGFTRGWRVTNNTIDAAIALIDLVNGIPAVDKSTPTDSYGTPTSTTASAVVGLPVQKHGRTSGWTDGQVYAINATVDVGYDTGVARFVGQIVITPGTFSAGGDSGSLIVVYKPGGVDDCKPVGLLFAGSSLYTIANPIDAVLTRFGVSVDGL